MKRYTDETAERYLDKTFPDTKGYQPSDRELAHNKVDPAVYRQLETIYVQLSDQYGRRPTVDEVVKKAQQQAYLNRRRGI